VDKVDKAKIKENNLEQKKVNLQNETFFPSTKQNMKIPLSTLSTLSRKPLHNDFTG
jgi:hypothetical protein